MRSRCQQTSRCLESPASHAGDAGSSLYRELKAGSVACLSCHAELPSSHCGGVEVTQPLCSRKKSASVAIPEGPKADGVAIQDHSRPSSRQNLHLCTQEAQTTYRWRIFGHTSCSRGLHPITQLQGMRSASVKNRATHGSFRGIKSGTNSLSLNGIR
ncbi:hypothetical protein BU25DRAFT_274837 [Macroventuria anomochaeta]|uniref:Uncharacterized protein n=1 Tax=Macroventuria anomochaeta TaxID=301207 RepID=A0ACB6S6K0_9PLEO|nr:uncharacterized protein BU25DRAFT_274837 [Macroventuria anomochaeta]KAF2629821.1 hypothetical protein BU25DRAFT_274837 [Macroventuria anomochaeta]